MAAPEQNRQALQASAPPLPHSSVSYALLKNAQLMVQLMVEDFYSISSFFISVYLRYAVALLCVLLYCIREVTSLPENILPMKNYSIRQTAPFTLPQTF